MRMRVLRPGEAARRMLQGEDMATALHEALDALDRKLEIAGGRSDRTEAA